MRLMLFGVVVFLANILSAHAGIVGGWAFGAGIKGVFWEMSREFESRVDTVARPIALDPTTVRGHASRSIKGAVGAAFVQKALYDFGVGSVFLRVQTHISELKWNCNDLTIYRNFEQGARVTPAMRNASLWGKVNEEYTIKPLRVWDLIAGAQALLGPLVFNVGAGVRWLFLESMMKVQNEVDEMALTVTGPLNMQKTMQMNSTAAHVFAVFECVIGWRIALPLPIIWQISGAFMAPRTFSYDADKKPRLFNFYDDKKNIAVHTTRFGTVRLGGGEIGMALTISL